ncbi:hypothetical protein D3C73_985100 [compost metagenome]
MIHKQSEYRFIIGKSKGQHKDDQQSEEIRLTVGTYQLGNKPVFIFLHRLDCAQLCG